MKVASTYPDYFWTTGRKTPRLLKFSNAIGFCDVSCVVQWEDKSFYAILQQESLT